MKEVLFVDDARLDRYAEQVNPSLTAIDKAKKFGFELSITGPKAALGQEERPRAWTRFEKMNAVLEHLREQNDLRVARPTDENEGPAFVHESCAATKIIVPYAATAGDFKNPELGLWFSAEFRAKRSVISSESDQRFHGKSITDFTGKRSAISRETDH